MAPGVRAHPVALCVSLALVSIYALRTVKSYLTGRLPPGPKGIPILGNLFQPPWKQFEVWKNQYGTTTHPSVIFYTDFVLNTGPLTYFTLGAKESSSSTRIKLQLTYWTVGDTSPVIDLVAPRNIMTSGAD